MTLNQLETMMGWRDGTGLNELMKAKLIELSFKGPGEQIAHLTKLGQKYAKVLTTTRRNSEGEQQTVISWDASVGKALKKGR